MLDSNLSRPNLQVVTGAQGLRVVDVPTMPRIVSGTPMRR